MLINALDRSFFWFNLADSGGMMHGMGWGFFWPMVIVGMVFWALAVYWVYQDAENTGKNGLLWALLVAFTMMMGFFVYLFVRFTDSTLSQPKDSEPHESQKIKKGIYCSNCGAQNLSDAQFCNQCAALL